LSFVGRTFVTNRHAGTDTGRQTDHAIYVAKGRMLPLLCIAMWPKNKLSTENSIVQWTI